MKSARSSDPVGPGRGLLRTLACLAVASMVLVVCAPVGGPGAQSRQFSSNGERIYFTAASASGQVISHPAGPSFGMTQRLACVDCHGADGHGGPVGQMMQTIDAPNITWQMLTKPGQMDHPPYTEGTIGRAITQGLDPAGQPLKEVMPRWSMSAQDLSDLVSFIKTLK